MNNATESHLQIALREQIEQELVPLAHSVYESKKAAAASSDGYFQNDGIQLGDYLTCQATYFGQIEQFKRLYLQIFGVIPSEKLERAIKRECYRIFENYFEGMAEGDFAAYFAVLLQQVLSQGKIDWSLISQKSDFEYLDDDEIDLVLDQVAKPMPLHSLKKSESTFAGLNSLDASSPHFFTDKPLRYNANKTTAIGFEEPLPEKSGELCFLRAKLSYSGCFFLTGSPSSSPSSVGNLNPSASLTGSPSSSPSSAGDLNPSASLKSCLKKRLSEDSAGNDTSSRTLRVTFS